MASRSRNSQGNRSYIQGAFGTKSSDEIAELLAPKSPNSSHGNKSRYIPIYDSQSSRPRMSSAITPNTRNRPVYETIQKRDAHDNFNSTPPYPYNNEMGPEATYAVQANPSTPIDTFTWESNSAQLPSQSLTTAPETSISSTYAHQSLEQKKYKHQESYTADDFLSTSSSPPTASTPIQSPFRDSQLSSLSLEIAHNFGNTPKPQQHIVTAIPLVKEKPAGARTRKLTDPSTRPGVIASSSWNVDVVSTSQRPSVHLISAFDPTGRYGPDPSTTLAVPTNKKKLERRDEYGRLLPDPGTRAVESTRYFDTACDNGGKGKRP
jgi:hypothetical protein